MLVEYTSLPETAKVWIYPSNRKFYDTEIEGLNQKIITFLESCNTDDETFQVSYKLLYNRFIVLFAASETPFTNTIIDDSVGFILQLQ